MQTFSSANRTCSASASAVECTATERMPISRHARITRSAISPRFAMSTFLNTRNQDSRSGLREADEALAVLDVLAVLDQDLLDAAIRLGFDLVHQLHGLDDADHLPLADRLPVVDERGRLRRGRPVEGSDEGRGDERAVRLGRAVDRWRERDGTRGPR